MDRGLLWSALVVLGTLDLQVVLPEGVKLAENCVQCLNFIIVGTDLRSLLTECCIGSVLLITVKCGIGALEPSGRIATEY